MIFLATFRYGGCNKGIDRVVVYIDDIDDDIDDDVFFGSPTQRVIWNVLPLISFFSLLSRLTLGRWIWAPTSTLSKSCWHATRMKRQERCFRYCTTSRRRLTRRSCLSRQKKDATNSLGSSDKITGLPSAFTATNRRMSVTGCCKVCWFDRLCPLIFGWLVK